MEIDGVRKFLASFTVASAASFGSFIMGLSILLFAVELPFDFFLAERTVT